MPSEKQTQASRANGARSKGPTTERVLAAMRGSPETSRSPGLLLRYEIAFDRQFTRALIRLLALQDRPSPRQNQPYHPTTPIGQTWKEELSKAEPSKEERSKKERSKKEPGKEAPDNPPPQNEPDKELKTKD